jgi:hypothetical protein
MKSTAWIALTAGVASFALSGCAFEMDDSTDQPEDAVLEAPAPIYGAYNPPGYNPRAPVLNPPGTGVYGRGVVNPPGYNPPGYNPAAPLVNPPGYNPPGRNVYRPGVVNPPGYNPPGYNPAAPLANPPGYNPPGTRIY